MAYALANALFQWEEGYRRLSGERDDPRTYGELMRAVDAIQEGLRRRLGSKFTIRELADLYAAGTDWCLEIAIDVAPHASVAWDMLTVADAAFYLYMREAADYGGGVGKPVERSEKGR